MQRKRVPFAIWVTLWAIIVIAALADHHRRRLVRDFMSYWAIDLSAGLLEKYSGAEVADRRQSQNENDGGCDPDHPVLVRHPSSEHGYALTRSTGASARCVAISCPVYWLQVARNMDAKCCAPEWSMSMSIDLSARTPIFQACRPAGATANRPPAKPPSG